MPGTIMSAGSLSYRIACTRPFRYRPPPQTQMSCRSHESHETPTNTGDGRVMLVNLACHKPREQLCLLSYFRLLITLSPLHRTDCMNRVLTSESGMLFSRNRRLVASTIENIVPYSKGHFFFNVENGHRFFSPLRH